MNKQKALLGFIVIIGLCFAAPCFSDQVEREALQKMYSEFLSSEGYEPQIDEDGDVAFTIDDWTFYIIVNDEDSGFFEVLLPNVEAWGFGDEMEGTVALAASQSSMSTKVAKAFITPTKNVHIRAEIFLAKPEDFSLHFDRMVDAIITAYNTFYIEMGYGEAVG